MHAAARPIILLTADTFDGAEREYRLRANYAEAIVEAGGAALMLPCEPDALEAALAVASGLVVTGTAPGAEVPEHQRAFERRLVVEALRRDLPVLGICHGMQVLGEALGGTVARDLPGLAVEVGPHMPHPTADRLAHPVQLAEGSRLADWHDTPSIEVNSLHRHALVGTGAMRVAAWAPDGVLEAVEGPGRRFCLGVQWHPEYRLTLLDRRIIAEFVGHCGASPSPELVGHRQEPAQRLKGEPRGDEKAASSSRSSDDNSARAWRRSRP